MYHRTIALLAALLWIAGPPAFGQDTLQITSNRSVVSVTAGERPVLKYQYVPKPRKPFAAEWFSPGGTNVLRDAPADHLHHHGLMFAVAVDGVDFWSENEKCGHESHVRLEDASPFTFQGVSWCGFTQTVDWVGPDGQTLLMKERRTIDVCRAGDPAASILVWNATLEAPPGKESIKLTGSPYFGLGMRFVQSMDKEGRFVNADGQTGVAGTNNVRSAWCAYSAAADGKPVTVAMFACPKNPRHPATWFTMDSPFAYLSATLNLHGEPLVIEAAKPLRLRYAAALWDGQVEPETIQKLYGQLLRGAEEADKSASAAEFESVPKTLPRFGDMYADWIAGIKESNPDRPSCPFSYAGPMTEAYLLGNIALKLNRKIEYDAKAMRVTNCEEANQYLRREYREGWEL
jgi:hypothetical protein